MERLLFRTEKIVVGANVQVPAGAEQIDSKGLVSVFPGMIDAGTNLGLASTLGVPHPVDLAGSRRYERQCQSDSRNKITQHTSMSRVSGITSVLHTGRRRRFKRRL